MSCCKHVTRPHKLALVIASKTANKGLFSHLWRFVILVVPSCLDVPLVFPASHQTILAEQYQRALDLIRTHRDKIDLLTASLMANNVVHKADLENLLGEKVGVFIRKCALERATER